MTEMTYDTRDREADAQHRRDTLAADTTRDADPQLAAGHDRVTDRDVLARDREVGSVGAAAGQLLLGQRDRRRLAVTAVARRRTRSARVSTRREHDRARRRERSTNSAADGGVRHVRGSVNPSMTSRASS